MTDKQQNILNAALELFALRGYAATSTSRIARRAGVSEGLIFRHFESKEGLLQAILDHGKEEVAEAYEQIREMGEPKEAIRAVLSLPFGLDDKQYHFWRLIYSLKWQMDNYDASMSAPLRNILLAALQQLGHARPEAEADLLMAVMDGLMTAVLLRRPENGREMLEALLNKYEL